MTWSPFFNDATPGPASTTMPAPSCPRMAGNKPSGSAPERVNSSVWQMPVALISTSTSPACGPSSSTVSILSGAPALCATAALTCMGGSFDDCLPQRTQRSQRMMPDVRVLSVLPLYYQTVNWLIATLRELG